MSRGYKHRKGTHLSKEQKERISVGRKRYLYNLSDEERSILFNKCARGNKSIVNFENKMIRCDSDLEAKFVNLAEELQLKNFDRCNRHINYIYEGEKHRYYPDFEFDYNGKRFIAEVKNSHNRYNHKVLAKESATIDSLKNIEYFIITEKQMNKDCLLELIS
jgi:hypothetical protein